MDKMDKITTENQVKRKYVKSSGGRGNDDDETISSDYNPVLSTYLNNVRDRCMNFFTRK